ncbi:divergent PAP2 family protein [Enterobacter asburiae]|nr:divergent PAP2 family protein [Enterobacter asburiae]
MVYSYLLTPFLAWFVTGCSKFIINSVVARRFAFDLIGYGGMPSNHSSIVFSMVSLIAFKNGVNDPAFGVALTLAFIVILDAKSLRKQVEKHAKALNVIQEFGLRERVGHSLLEIACGCVVGSCVGFGMSLI